MELAVSLPDDVIEVVAQRAASLMSEELQLQRSAWLDTRGAAEWLSTTEDAVRGLVRRRQIPVHRTPNGRLLFDRRELDTWVRSEARA